MFSSMSSPPQSKESKDSVCKKVSASEVDDLEAEMAALIGEYDSDADYSSDSTDSSTEAPEAPAASSTEANTTAGTESEEGIPPAVLEFFKKLRLTQEEKN